MSFIETVPEDAAPGNVATMYDRFRDRNGYLPNYARVFHAPVCQRRQACGQRRPRVRPSDGGEGNE